MGGSDFPVRRRPETKIEREKTRGKVQTARAEEFSLSLTMETPSGKSLGGDGSAEGKSKA